MRAGFAEHPFIVLSKSPAHDPTLCLVMRIGAFAFAEHIKYSLASRKTAAFAGRVSLLPYSAKMRYYITKPVARPNAMSF